MHIPVVHHRTYATSRAVIRRCRVTYVLPHTRLQRGVRSFIPRKYTIFSVPIVSTMSDDESDIHETASSLLQHGATWYALIPH